MKFFEKIKLFAIDLDGTLYFGKNVAPGANEFIEYLREKYRIAFFTNNSSQNNNEVLEKLNGMGIECSSDEIHTSSSAMVSYLKESSLDNIYVIGSESFRTELESNGLRIVDSGLADNLVVGLDRDFHYNKISNALLILLNGGKFIVCNEDSSFPVGENTYMPGCGAIVGAIVSSAKKKPDYIVGKPNTYMLSKIARANKVKNYEIVVIGDSSESDIQMAINYNCKGVLINSNCFHTNENVLVTENLNKLLNYMRKD